MKHPLRLVKENTDYRRLWIAETLVLIGASLRTIAIPWLVLELTGSPFLLGVALAIGVIPEIVFAPFVGYYIDRFSRRTVMVGSVLIEAVVMALVPLFAFIGVLSVEILFLVLAFVSLTRAGYHNARETTLPALVSDADLDEANAHFYIAGSMLSIVFMVIGGGLTQYIGGIEVLGMAAVFAGVAAAPLWMVPAPVPQVDSLGGPREVLLDFVSEMSDGVEVIRGTVVRDIILFGIGINIATVPFMLLITTVSWDAFGFALAYGILLGSFKLGHLLGNWGVNEVALPREQKFAVGIIAVGVVALGIGFFGPLFGIAPDAVYLVLLSISFVLLGGMEPLFNVPSDSLVQVAADDEDRGKVITLTNSAMEIPFPFAHVAAGALLALVSPFAIFAFSGLFMLVLGGAAAARFGIRPPEDTTSVERI